MNKLSEIPEEFIRPLIEVLVRTEVLWQPFRNFQFNDWRAGMAVIQQRRDYRRRGVMLSYSGSDAHRMGESRRVAAMKKAGLLEVNGRGRGRGLLLTRFADDYLRSMLPTKRLDEAWPILQRVEATYQRIGSANAGFTLEFDVVGGEYGPEQIKECHALADEAAVLELYGLLEIFSDTQGRLGYKLTEAGTDALKAGPMPEPEVIPEYRADLSAEYIDDVNAGLTERN